MVVIVAVVAGMTIPRLAGSWGATNLRNSAGDLLAAARYAHDYAVTRRTRCRLVLDPQEGRYGIEAESTDPATPGQFTAVRDAAMRPRSLGRDVRFGLVRIEPRSGDDFAAEGAGNAIAFEPTGEADAAVIELTNGSASWTLRIAPNTGRMELVQGRVTEGLNDRRDLDAS